MSLSQLSLATPADVPEMAIIYTSAFSKDPSIPVALPSTILRASYERWIHERLTVAFKKPGVEHWKMTDPETGKMLAWCRWEFPRVLTAEQEEEEKKNEVKVELPKGANLEYWESLFGGIERMREKYVEKGKMHIVHFLCVHQDYQRRGLGSTLLRHGLAIADASNFRVCIEATAAGLPLYLKLGWRVVDVLTHDMADFGGSGTVSHHIMIRELGGKVVD